MERESTTGSNTWYSTRELELAHRILTGNMARCGVTVLYSERYRGADDTKTKCGLCSEECE